ncbi:hypothetical protein [Myxococcus phage Mx1]|nr:hypothetical protein [Myxococcus phage Mx1]
MTKTKDDVSKLSTEDLKTELARREEEARQAHLAGRAGREAAARNAMTLIEVHVSEAYAALEKATKLADEHGLNFSFDPAYGMGGTYHGTKTEEQKKDLEDSGEWYSSDEGWVSSSQNC